MMYRLYNSSRARVFNIQISLDSWVMSVLDKKKCADLRWSSNFILNSLNKHFKWLWKKDNKVRWTILQNYSLINILTMFCLPVNFLSKTRDLTSTFQVTTFSLPTVELKCMTTTLSWKAKAPISNNLVADPEMLIFLLNSWTLWSSQSTSPDTTHTNLMCTQWVWPFWQLQIWNPVRTATTTNISKLMRSENLRFSLRLSRDIRPCLWISFEECWTQMSF